MSPAGGSGGQIRVPSEAAAGTPAAGVWSEIAGRMAQLDSASEDAVDGLRRALMSASEDYALADSTAQLRYDGPL